MPLLDHFHPPLSERRPWESFHATWCGSLADLLNRDVLPPGYIALEQVQIQGAREIDLWTWDEWRVNPTVVVALPPSRAIWTPTAPPVVLPGAFLERFAVEIVSTEGGRTLVAAIELVSPGNKDRETKRRLFAARCAAYLARGIGLVVVDVVSSCRANLHNELLNLLGLDASFQMPRTADLYAVAYRPLQRDGADQIDTWPMPLAVGQPLPTVPLSLEAQLCVAVDLEAAYLDACQRRKVDEALG